MPVAHVYGWEPAMAFCASAPVPTGVCEYDVMGAMRGEPVPLVKCETSDLMVPADAEMVIEGYIDSDPETFEMEGPFGEYTGYFGGDQGPKHVTKVTSVSYRNGSIHRGVQLICSALRRAQRRSRRIKTRLLGSRSHNCQRA